MNRRHAVFLLLASLLAGCAGGPRAPAGGPGVVSGPERGALVIAGGGRLGQDVLGRFIELAGGPDAPIVVIPTAGGDDAYGPDWEGLQVLRAAGARNLSVLHSYDPREANTAAFVEPLRRARGVWIPGGRQWRLADAYLDTRTHRELSAVLARGGVIGGSSAGASIQASYLVRGAPEGNHVVMSPGHEKGFGFLSNSAIDQHLLTRGRENDLLQVIRVHPHLLGIGIDEGTAIVVQGDRFEVVGSSKVAVYPGQSTDGGPGYFFLSAGDRFDLRTRTAVK